MCLGGREGARVCKPGSGWAGGKEHGMPALHGCCPIRAWSCFVFRWWHCPTAGSSTCLRCCCSPAPARCVACCPRAATALLAHKVTADTTIGAEVVRDLAANTTTFAAGRCTCVVCDFLTCVRRPQAGVEVWRETGRCIAWLASSLLCTLHCASAARPNRVPTHFTPLAPLRLCRPVQAAGGRRADQAEAGQRRHRQRAVRAGAA